ncbi:MAG: PSD1 domain-containing protein [Planctomycetaceae bacterium]|nr:PSD1 domain-containing protein [Planctomycetaceae bacterium]
MSVVTVLLLVSISLGEEIRFNRDILPILSNHCFQCHGPDAKTREAGLRLDVRDSALQESESGSIAIVAGDPVASELMLRITSADPDVQMPPVDGPKKLTDKQIQLLTEWIRQGANYESHWAFVSPVRPEVPQVVDRSWVKNEIDEFVGKNIVEAGLKPAPEATKETLIRRVAFDLTGLPPTLEEIDAFLSDQTPQAYERVVDYYLSRPAYGEHMSRHWLDLARYADTNGYQYDTERQQWVWRDWVIDAYNRNLPFDEFTVQQLAGDLLPNATPQQRLATGFNRNHGITIEGGIIDEEYRTEYVMDRLVTTSAVWMGLTMGCARCHDHKYDPISQKEFYGLYAFFNQVPERGMNGFAPQEIIPSPLVDASLKEFSRELEELKAELAQPLDVEQLLDAWAKELASSGQTGWQILSPETMKSSGGSTLTKQEDNSILAGGENPQHDIYEITAFSGSQNMTAVRLEALTHPSLPAGGPGRHSNSNFVLSEFELTAVSVQNPTDPKVIKFARAEADYSQANYEVARTIDGTVANNNGWAVDGPTRKEPATAMFVASEPFGFEGGTELRFRLRHEANFATHGIGRPRLSVTTDDSQQLTLQGIPHGIRKIAGKEKSTRSPEELETLTKYFLAHNQIRKPLEDRVAVLEKQISAAIPATMIMQDLPQPRETFVLNRGQYNEPTDRVEPGVPGVFPELTTNAPRNRLDFANWLTDPRHPLTARVAVNRYWQRLFGVGLVKTSEDFGVQGELPSHPELLDWLATEFVQSGWNIKHIQRLMVTSATYRQSSHVGQASFLQDPENRILARGPRMRLDGEEVRDAALAISGLLQQQLGGRSVYPYQPPGLWMELNNRPGYSKEYPQGKGEDLYRRSLYTFWKRTVPSPMLKTFDAPEREFCTVKRSRTNTPLQALLLLNGPQFVEAARHLAERMLKEGGSTTEEHIQYGFRLVTARSPSQAEVDILKEEFQSSLVRFERDTTSADAILKVGESPASNELNQNELAAMTGVARLLLNLNEAITKG